MAKKKDTQKIILEAAFQLFWEKSYTAVSMDLICKTAHVQKGSLYYFFPSKDALAVAVLDYFWQNYENDILKPAFDDKTIPPLARLEKYYGIMRERIMGQFEETKQFYGCPFGNITAEQGSQNERIRQKGDECFHKYQDYFMSTLEEAKADKSLREGLEPEEVSRLFCSCWQGNIVLAKAYNDPSKIWQPISTLLGLIKAV